MKFHIVRDGETIHEIMFLYKISEDELKEDNRHIRSWDNLIPGTKLKISTVIDIDDHDILQMEPFIEDYYPKDINIEPTDKIEKVQIEDKMIEPIELENEEVEVIEEEKEEEKPKEIYINKSRKVNNRPNIVYYPYYVYYPIYSPYYCNYKKGK